MFNHVYPIFYVRFYCKGCVWERVWRLKISLKTKWISREVIPRSKPHAKHMTGMRRIMILASNSQVRPSHEIPVKHFIFLFWHICSTMSSPTLYIPSLSTYCKECFSKRKPWHTHLRVRDCHTHNHLHNPLWFSSTPTSPYPYPWEVDSSNTYHTQSECKVRFWCCWEALEEANH